MTLYFSQSKHYLDGCVAEITCSASLSQPLIGYSVYCSEENHYGAGIAWGMDIQTAKERATKIVCSEINMNNQLTE